MGAPKKECMVFMTASYHIPVLLSESIAFLNVQEGAWYIDATLGGGGYTEAILKKHGNVLGIDQDADAITYTRERLKRELPEKHEGRDYMLIHENFKNIEAIVRQEGISEVNGIVFDLGVSSYQLDTKKRGFSYRYLDAPLDMRMNRDGTQTASSIVNTYTKEELYEIFARYGEEERARAIANAFVLARRVKPIATMGDIVSIVSTVGGNQEKTLSRICQALRIVVNDELTALREGLLGAERILPSKGRLVVVSFHSLEDRIVKQWLRRPSWSIIADVVRPSKEEVDRNKRARSAKLRAGEKL